jgi:hypothetical protein
VPSLDTLAVPQVSVDATSDVVEILAKAASVRVDESAAVVVRIAAGALGVDDGGSMEIFRNRGVEVTACCGVKGVLVLRAGVDTFDNVDFATFGPVWTDGPPSGPNAATGWHCEYVCDEEPAVVGLFGADSDTVNALVCVKETSELRDSRISVTTNWNVGCIVNSQDCGTITLNIGETS